MNKDAHNNSRGLRVHLNVSYVAIGIFFIVATAISFYLFDDLGRVIRATERQAIPDLLGVMQLSQQSASLATVAGALAAAEDREELRERSRQASDTLRSILDDLKGIGGVAGKERAESLRLHLEDLGRIHQGLENRAAQRIRLREQRAEQWSGIRELQADVREWLNPYFADLPQPPGQAGRQAPTPVIPEAPGMFEGAGHPGGDTNELRLAMAIEARGSRLCALLNSAMQVDGPDELTALHDQYRLVSAQFDRALAAFDSRSGGKTAEFRRRFAALIASPENLLQIHADVLRLRGDIGKRLRDARFRAEDLSLDVARLVDVVRQGMHEQTAHANETQQAGRRYLIATLIAGLFYLALVALTTVRGLQNREQALQQARAEAEQANSAKSAFLANMSHEIRTPLNAILGLTHLLQTELREPRQLDRLDKIGSSGHHLLSVINNILDISKIEAGSLRLEQDEFEIRDVLGRVCKIMCPRADEKDLEVVYDVVPELEIPVRGDSHRLGQILLNLIGNAIKFTDKGVITVSVRPGGPIEQQFLVRFDVCDTGIGIAPDSVARMFQPFVQEDAGTTRRYEGTGLGLAICKRLVERMGGEIGVQSRLGEGSCFWFTLRLRQGEERVQRIWRPIDLNDRRVLVVDDLASAREVLGGMLVGFGMRVDRAESGRQALEMIQRADDDGEPYEVLLLDWHMPEMDGLETAQRVSGLSLATPPSYLMVTAFGDQLPVDDVERWGFKKVIPKPVTPSTLHDILLEVLLERIPPIDDAQRGPLSNAERQLAEEFAGVSILLVEDNATNREVALELLREAGLKVDCAENGSEALALAERRVYRLVLMDMQMPVMDGLQATEAIRTLPDYKRVPILAMTANAFEEDREQCLSVGMNDHISKPVVPADLYGKVLFWLLKSREHSAAQAIGERLVEDGAADSREPKAPEDLANIPGLDTEAGLISVNGRESAYRRVLDIYRNQHLEDMALLREALAEGDRDSAARRAHSLKGASRTIGALILGDQCAELERLLRQDGETADIDRLSREIEEQYHGLARALGQVLESGDDEEPAPDDGLDDFSARIDELTDLLKQQDMRAIERIQRLLPSLRERFGDDVDRLQEDIESFRFKEALLFLKRFLEN